MVDSTKELAGSAAQTIDSTPQNSTKIAAPKWKFKQDPQNAEFQQKGEKKSNCINEQRYQEMKNEDNIIISK